MGKDILYALRVLRRSPHFAITAIGILALGIGANSAMFSLVYSVLLRPLPYHDPGRIAVLLGSTPRHDGTFPLPPADFLDLRAQSRGFATMAAAELWNPSLTGEGEAEEIAGTVWAFPEPNNLPFMSQELGVHSDEFFNTVFPRRLL